MTEIRFRGTVPIPRTVVFDYLTDAGVTDGEFASWARMIAGTYGMDRSEEELTDQRAALAAAGLVEELRPGALALASAAFRGEREPWYPGGWAFPLY
jgi:hypothetical protein